MEQSFTLPNEVCGSKNKGSRTTLAVTRKYNKVSTMKTSVARPSKTMSAEPAWNDDAIAGTRKIAELATTLKILKLACVCLAITTVINSATFGGLIKSLVSWCLFVFVRYGFPSSLIEEGAVAQW